MAPNPREKSDARANRMCKRLPSALPGLVQRRTLIAGIAATTFLAFPLTAAYCGECDSAVSTMAKGECESARLEAVSAQLRREYDQVVAELPKSRLWYEANLKINQDAWTTYVDSQCELKGALAFGSAEAWVVPQCKTEAYQKRLRFLTGMLSTLKDSEQ